MKNRRMIVGITACLIVVAVLCPSALAAGKKFSLGLNAGGGSVISMSQSWRAGFELGFRAGEHLAVAADLSFGALTLENSSSVGNYSAKDSQKWTNTPISLSLLYAAPLNEKAVAYLGAGIGYHFFNRTTSSETNVYGQLQKEFNESSFHALAPLVVLSLEFSLGKSLALKGDLSYVFGTASRQETVNGLATSQDINFGGASLTVGVRLYL